MCFRSKTVHYVLCGFTGHCTVGQHTHTHTHTHTEPPSPPRNLTVINVTDTSVALSWEEPTFKGGRNEVEYRLWYMASGDTERTLFGTVSTTSGQITGTYIMSVNHTSLSTLSLSLSLSLSHTHTELTPGVSYTVFVTAENDISNQVPESLFDTRAETVPVITSGGAVDNTPLIAGVVAAVVAVIVLVLVIFIVLLIFCL